MLMGKKLLVIGYQLSGVENITLSKHFFFILLIDPCLIFFTRFAVPKNSFCKHNSTKVYD